MSAKEKAQVLEKVEATAGSKRKVLSELGVSKCHGTVKSGQWWTG